MVLDPLEAVIIAVPVGAVVTVAFFDWLYPKLRQRGYWRFVEAWTAFWLAAGVSGLVLGSVTIGIGLVTALEYFVLAQVASLASATVVFRWQTQALARRDSQKLS
ncbi:MAG: hypothetical protein OK441_06680 [Thaumarchaeota archaeon]|nr:hypothetical protein [Nitrososphaerota archaeon]